MEIKSDLPSHIPDNDANLIDFLKCAINHGDPRCKTMISRNATGLLVAIEPSDPEFKKNIIKNVLDSFYKFGIKPEFSKSTEIQKKIIFSVVL